MGIKKNYIKIILYYLNNIKFVCVCFFLKKKHLYFNVSSVLRGTIVTQLKSSFPTSRAEQWRDRRRALMAASSEELFDLEAKRKEEDSWFPCRISLRSSDPLWFITLWKLVIDAMFHFNFFVFWVHLMVLSMSWSSSVLF